MTDQPFPTDPHRWTRRSRSIPSVLVGTGLALICAPALLPLALVGDVVRGRRRFPVARTYLFALRYGFNDSVEILLAPILWVLGGLGHTLDSPPSQRRHRRLVAWSVRTLHRDTERLLGLRFDPSEVLAAHIARPGPLIVISRHVSMLDSTVPTLTLGLDGTWTVRGVFTDDALADPGFDLIYQRTGSVFIDRDAGRTARRILAGFRDHQGPGEAAVIYPEGQLATAVQRERALARLADDDPERAERLADLQHLLPPRPGGTLALLEALPTADVLVLGHVGAEPTAVAASLLHRAPVDSVLRVKSWRIEREQIPREPADRVKWLDQTWLDLDHWVADQLRSADPRGPEPSRAALGGP